MLLRFKGSQSEPKKQHSPPVSKPKMCLSKATGIPWETQEHTHVTNIHDWGCTLSSWVKWIHKIRDFPAQLKWFHTFIYIMENVGSSVSGAWSKLSQDASITLATKYVYLQFTYLSIVAGFSDGFWRKSILDQNTNGLPGAHENAYQDTYKIRKI